MVNENSGNGWKVNVAEFRGYMKEKIESIERRIGDEESDSKDFKKYIYKEVTQIKCDMNEIKISLATHQLNCIQIQPIKDINQKIQELKDAETKRKAVKHLVSGFLGFVGGAFMFLFRDILKKLF